LKLHRSKAVVIAREAGEKVPGNFCQCLQALIEIVCRFADHVNFRVSSANGFSGVDTALQTLSLSLFNGSPFVNSSAVL
jgi:hypothetical protein